MRSRLGGIGLGLVVSLLLAGLAAAQGADSQSASEAGTGYLCPSRLQLRHPERCPNDGPGAALTELAIQGLYPLLPLPLAPTDYSLGFVPFDFLRVQSEGAEIFPSAGAAASGSGASGSAGSGFVFLAYSDKLDTDGGTVYATVGGFARGDSVSEVTPAAFQGLAFRRTPDRPFGWVISGGSCTERTPGGPQDYTGRCYMKYEVIQVYAVQPVGEWNWYQIGPEEWIEQRMVALVFPDTEPPPGVPEDRWISVNLYEQTIAAYADGELVYATVTSTGQNGMWTQPGAFQVWAELQVDTMTGGIPGENYYYLENVPWVLYFDRARALHGTYWHNRFGAPTSRGCVNLSIADAHWFYEFAGEGTWVYVWDPSGNTPTDPSYYEAGGA